MSRRKAPSQQSPQNLSEATDLAVLYIDLQDRVDREKHEAQADIDERKARRDKAIAPLEAEMKTMFAELRTWWSANKGDLTGGKRRSIELAGAEIGERKTTPSLALPRGLKLDDLLAWLLERELFAFVRIKHSVDKPAAIRSLRALASEPGLEAPDSEVIEHRTLAQRGKLLTEKGVSLRQRDEFFIDRVDREDDKPEIVPVDDEGGAS